MLCEGTVWNPKSKTKKLERHDLDDHKCDVGEANVRPLYDPTVKAGNQHRACGMW